jgi:hypothetical protein
MEAEYKSTRLNKERQEKLEPLRMQIAIEKLGELGFDIIYKDNTSIKFEFKKKVVTYFPYSGWASGATINDGRGLENLLEQLRLSSIEYQKELFEFMKLLDNGVQSDGARQAMLEDAVANYNRDNGTSYDSFEAFMVFEKVYSRNGM